MHNDIEKTLVSEDLIKSKVKELGNCISTDYKGKNLVVIGILKGAVIFLSDLVRKINIPLQMDFMAVSSYGVSTHTSGVVRILKDLEGDIAGKDVLIIEDIVDTGLTLSYLKDNLKSRNPASIKICTFLDKPSRRKVTLVPDYKGYDIPNEFAVGYGLDFSGRYRNLPYVGALKPECYQK
ncbi:MAG: hypoxanthine phosphoribosyltransferase [Clostridia bacterium]|nr:hypoxanthine phosphoribosyltransferase [Clostridia bacterium]